MELWPTKAIEYSKLGELFYGSWEVRMLRAMQMVGAWLMKFQKKAKTLLGLLCEESVVSGQLELKSWL